MVKSYFIEYVINFIKTETKLFSKNQHKCIYSIDLIISEIIYMLKNVISKKDYRGPIDHSSLYYNFRVLSNNILRNIIYI